MTKFEKFKEACANGDVAIVKLFLKDKNFCATEDNNAGLIAAVKFKRYVVIEALLTNSSIRQFEINNDFPTLRAAMEFTDTDPLLDVPYHIARNYFSAEFTGTELQIQLVNKRHELRRTYMDLEELFLFACETNDYDTIDDFFKEYPRFDPTFQNFTILMSYAERNFAVTVKALLQHPKILALESKNFELKSECFPAIYSAIKAGNTGVALMMVKILREYNPQNTKFIAALDAVADNINKIIAIIGSVKEGDTEEYIFGDIHRNADGNTERSSISSNRSMLFSDPDSRRASNTTQTQAAALAINDVPTVAAPRRQGWFSFSCTRG